MVRPLSTETNRRWLGSMVGIDGWDGNPTRTKGFGSGNRLALDLVEFGFDSQSLFALMDDSHLGL